MTGRRLPAWTRANPMSPRVSIRLLAAQSDQRLVALINEGHERAFEALVKRYRRPLLLYCRHAMRLSEAGAEDVLQHALLQAWLALARGTQVRDLKPWLYRIVHNTAVSSMRGCSEDHSELSEATQARTAAGGESALDGRMAVRETLSGVAALPRMQRQAIFLTAVDGRSHDEVASALGITHGAVRGLLYRARATLRSAAAAITPEPLIQWASGAGTSAPTADRVAELSAAGGAFGTTGLLLKGAVVAVTAGALATGAAAVHPHPRHAERSSGRAPSVAVTSSTGTVEKAVLRAARAIAFSPATDAQAGSQGARAQVGAHAWRGGREFARAGAPPASRLLQRAPTDSSTRVDAREEGPQSTAGSGSARDASGSGATSGDSTEAERGDSSTGSPKDDGHHVRDGAAQGSSPPPPPTGTNVAGPTAAAPGSEEPGGGKAEPTPGTRAESRHAVATEDHPGGQSAGNSDG